MFHPFSFVLYFLYFIPLSAVFAADAFLNKNYRKWIEIQPEMLFSAVLILFAFPFALTCFSLLFKKGQKIITFILAALLYIFSYGYISHLLLFSVAVNSNSLFAVFDTNPNETFEFLKILPAWFLLFSILYFGTGLFLFIKSKIPENTNRKKVFLAFLCSFSAVAFFNFISPYSNLGFISQFTAAYTSYKKEIKEINRISETISNNSIPGISSFIDSSTPQTYVVVIGESASRSYFPSYRKDKSFHSFLDDRTDFIVFNNILSAAPVTLAALKSFLIVHEKDHDFGLIQFFKSAGFKTFWISNQFRIGRFDSAVSIIARQSDQTRFINNGDFLMREASSYDQELIPYYEKAVNDPAPKKIIFVHLFGSHTPYALRYPRDFNPSMTPGAFLEKGDDVPAYEKSLAYTDTILNKMFSLLEDRKEASFFLYFSDHGSSPVNPADRFLPGHFEIPFILWISPSYIQENKEYTARIKQRTNTSYQMNRFFHTLTGLARLKHDFVSDEDDLFSAHFKEKPAEINLEQ